MSTPMPPPSQHAAPAQAPYGGGRRLNKVALYLLGTAVAIFLLIMAMVANDRANPKLQEADTIRRHGNTSLFARELAGDRPVLALVPVLIALFLFVRYCGETRGLDLRDLEASPADASS